MTLVLRQAADQLAVWAPHQQLLDLPVGDGVREDVGQGDGGVVMGTRLALTEPGHQAGGAEPVATGGLLGVSLTQQTDGTLKLCRELLHQVVVVPALVVMFLSGVHRDVMTNTDSPGVRSIIITYLPSPLTQSMTVNDDFHMNLSNMLHISY